MKHSLLPLIFIIFLCACEAPQQEKNSLNKKTVVHTMPFTETEILGRLDLTFKQLPAEDFPEGNPEDVKYNFFLDLEQGYCQVAGSRIHLYADETRWAVVFETNGYQTRAFDAEITLNYVGNCIDYPVSKYKERSYITNSSTVVLIEEQEFERVRNKTGSDMETFELIGAETPSINVRGQQVVFENDYRKYKQHGILVRDYDNPDQRIGFADWVRYLNEVHPEVTRATEEDLRKHLPADLPKVMTIDQFHFESVYNENNLPSKQETYQLIAKVLKTRNTAAWNPKLKPNNHWSNWESGAL